MLTVLLEDVDEELRRKGTPTITNTWSVMRLTFDLELLDDTLTTTQMQMFLHALENQAEMYGMRLNQIETEILADPRHGPVQVRFKDGNTVPTTTQNVYLGSMISWSDTFSTAFQHRAALAEAAYKQLKLVWNSSMPCKQKHLYFPISLCRLPGIRTRLSYPHGEAHEAYQRSPF